MRLFKNSNLKNSLRNKNNKILHVEYNLNLLKFMIYSWRNW